MRNLSCKEIYSAFPNSQMRSTEYARNHYSTPNQDMQTILISHIPSLLWGLSVAGRCDGKVKGITRFFSRLQHERESSGSSFYFSQNEYWSRTFWTIFLFPLWSLLLSPLPFTLCHLPVSRTSMFAENDFTGNLHFTPLWTDTNDLLMDLCFLLHKAFSDWGKYTII